MNNNDISRRKFIQSSGLAMIGTGAILSGCGSNGDTVQPSMPPKPQPTLPVDDGELTITPQQKSLVFIMLDGGNDSYNMLIPTSNSDYNEYKQSRGSLAIDQAELLSLNNFTDGNNKSFGLHPSLPKTKRLFENKNLAFIANVAPLIEPITKAEFIAGAKPVPLGLMSHSDQFKHWQTSRPAERLNTGWFGSFSDVLQKSLPNDGVSMNISLAGSNIMQNGQQTREYSITSKGSVGLKVKRHDQPHLEALNTVLQGGFDKTMETSYPNAFSHTYIEGIRYAQTQHETFEAATESISVNTDFSSRTGEESDLAAQLKMVAKTIAARNKLGMSQQTFFIRYIGWDHHSELLNKHREMLGVLDDALAAFQSSLNELDIADNVITFTGSDFGRSLTSNGNGTDHDWGGNTLVMGTHINGGKIYGEYPKLSLGQENPLDIGGGVLIPTTATDEIYAELALWFGVDKQDLGKLFPNLKNFYDNNSKLPPLGAVSPT